LASASFWSAPGLEHDQAAAAGPDRLCGLRAVRHHRGPAPLEGLLQNWILPFTEFVPQLLLALMTVQFFEELGCAGFVQHRLQSRHGALNASFLVALAFAFLHLPTYLSAPISGAGALRDLSVMVIVSVRNLFPDPHHLRLQPHPVQRPHRLHHPRLFQRTF
jgi:hypothetical protein